MFALCYLYNKRHGSDKLRAAGQKQRHALDLFKFHIDRQAGFSRECIYGILSRRVREIKVSRFFLKAVTKREGRQMQSRNHPLGKELCLVIQMDYGHDNSVN